MADTQIFIKLLNNKTLTLQFPSQFPITPQLILNQIQSQFQFQTLILTLNGKLLPQSTQTKIPNYSTLTLTLPLNGGKGGFGSLLRGAGTKAGQKKTNNFDACRDMSGRRLRHVNAEKKMEEWKSGEEERNLEKKAEKFLKDLVKKGKGGKRDDVAEKYVEKYRVESAWCVEEVDRSVREAAKAGLVGRKRKGVEKGKKGCGDAVDAKKLKIWMGKRKIGDSDSDNDSDSDSDDSDGDAESDGSDTENEKSAVTENGSQSDSIKDAINCSISAEQLGFDQSGKGSSDSGSGEDETLTGANAETDTTLSGSHDESNGNGLMETSSDGEEKILEKPCVSAEIVSDQLSISSAAVEVDGTQSTTADELPVGSECKSAFSGEVVNGKSNVPEVLLSLNFDGFSSASELEVLGMERLKSELQVRGLKCGGTLQERAARLFLLKATPLEKLPKKLLAKK